MRPYLYLFTGPRAHLLSGTFCVARLAHPKDVPGGQASLRGLLQITLFGARGVGECGLPDEAGETGGLRIVVGPESLVANVHLRQTAVNLIGALVEPPAVVLGDVSGKGAEAA